MALMYGAREFLVAPQAVAVLRHLGPKILQIQLVSEQADRLVIP
jgi:hypothetical protein